MTDISPALFFDAALGYQKTAAIKAAVALDLFTAVSQSGGGVEAIAKRTGAAARGVRILCDYLTLIGFLERDGDCYRPTRATEAFLTTTSPAWLGGAVDFLAAPEMMSLWLGDPVSYVRNGGSAGLAHLAADHPIWVKFARAMAPMMAPAAQAVADEIDAWRPQPRRLLDVAAGHGMFGITLAKALPRLHVVAIDWDAVLAVAKENAAAAGVSARYRTVSGSAFEVQWGQGFDVVLLTNFLHHFDKETCIGLLAKARESLAPGGRLLAVDMVPDEARLSPAFAAAFPFMMLASTPAGDAYTALEFEEMSRWAGFGECVVRALAPTPMSLVTFA